MAEKITVARPYARAVYELAKERSALPKWSEMLADLARIIEVPILYRLIRSPLATPQVRAALIIEIAGDALDEQGRGLIRLLADNRRLELLPEIAAMFETLRGDAEGTLEVEMSAAAPMDKEQQEHIRAALSKRLGRDVHLHSSVDKSLLGGAIIRAGDLVIDGSLKNKLERLAGAMIQ
ncbi:MAG: F0F1 ATP synthase subunit delta [Burkholderiales bacterium]